MKFKATLHGAEMLFRLCQALEKNAKTCVCHFAERKLQFILSSDAADGMQVWSGLPTSEVLKDIIIESLHRNEVVFELSLEHFLRALKSASTSGAEVVMKLTKKNGAPYLSFTIVVQDVPITLFSAQQFSTLLEPQLPDPKVTICLPQFKILRPIVERLKNISDNLTLWANMAGRLTLKIDTTTTTVDTFFEKLEHPSITGRSPVRIDPSIDVAIKVEIKKFVRFLHSGVINPTNVICCTLT